MILEFISIVGRIKAGGGRSKGPGGSGISETGRFYL